MGITTQISLTSEWVQVAPANQRVVLQRLTGNLYLRYSATQPTEENIEAFRLYDNTPLELANDQPLWAKAKGTGYLILVPIPAASGGGAPLDPATETTLAAIDSKLGGTLVVTVDNQLDLGTITSHLLSIKNSVAAIDANTDTVEQKLLDTVSAINSSGAVNHADLLDLLAQLQAVNANTDTVEAVLGNILTKIIASPATLAEQQVQTTLLNNVAKDGADITAPFAMPAGGSGIRGWLSALWTKINGTLAISAAALPLPAGASTSANQTTEITALQLIDNSMGSVAGGAAGTNSNLAGAVYLTPMPTLTNGQQVGVLVDNKGRPLKPVTNGRVPYIAATAPDGFTAPTAALTDFFRFSGSATKTVYIKRITVSSFAGGRSGNSIGGVKRSTANTGGTVIALTALPVDSTAPAATASASVYTASPTTLGTSVAPVLSGRFMVPKHDDQVNMESVFDFTATQPLVLRGVNEGLSLVVGNNFQNGTSLFITIEWDEE